jgi:chemotaxis protein MotA
LVGIIGIVIILVMVFGGYVFTGGKIEIIVEAVPHEMIIIGGAAAGAFIISNDTAALKQTLRDMGKVFKGTKWKGADYQDLLCLLFELIKTARSNPVELEGHIEEPQDSAIWAKYPRIQHDHSAVDLICDTFRNATMNYDDPNQVEEVLDKQLEAEKHHALHSSHAMQQMADALPALGIVAAVLGVIKTMASIDQPPEVLGRLIASALVGTFLGVFLAYGLMGPFAAKVKSIIEADYMFYALIREVLVANLHNHAPNICIEVGRQNTPHAVRPSFNAMDEALRATKGAAA